MSERKKGVLTAEQPEVEEETVPGTGPAFIEDTTVEQEAPTDIPPGHVVLTYQGTADRVEHGALSFRVGQPVIVPSDVAEKLLTMLPDEKFDRKE